MSKSNITYQIWHTYDFPTMDGDGTWQFPAGWWYWYCSPAEFAGSEPVGPFETHDDALEACRHDIAERLDVPLSDYED